MKIGNCFHAKFFSLLHSTSHFCVQLHADVESLLIGVLKSHGVFILRITKRIFHRQTETHTRFLGPPNRVVVVDVRWR